MWVATYWQLLIVPTCCILTEAPNRKNSLDDSRQQMYPGKVKTFVFKGCLHGLWPCMRVL